MLTLLFSAVLSFHASAGVFNKAWHFIKGPPAWTTIAPCDADYSCIMTADFELNMKPLGIQRGEYEILAGADPGILLVKSNFGTSPLIMLIELDGGIDVVSTGLSEQVRPSIPPEVIASFKTPDLRLLMEARTEDQIRVRADRLARNRSQYEEATDYGNRVVADAQLMSREVSPRVDQARLAYLNLSKSTPIIPAALWSRMKEIEAKVNADMATCGLKPDCSEKD